jgi:hypothetical protein
MFLATDTKFQSDIQDKMTCIGNRTWKPGKPHLQNPTTQLCLIRSSLPWIKLLFPLDVGSVRKTVCLQALSVSTKQCRSWHGLHSLGSRDRGFKSHTRHGCLVCVCVYSEFVLSCVRKRPCEELITRPRSPTVCKNDQWNWEISPMLQSGSEEEKKCLSLCSYLHHNLSLIVE